MLFSFLLLPKRTHSHSKRRLRLVSFLFFFRLHSRGTSSRRWTSTAKISLIFVFFSFLLQPERTHSHSKRPLRLCSFLVFFRLPSRRISSRRWTSTAKISLISCNSFFFFSLSYSPTQAWGKHCYSKRPLRLFSFLFFLQIAFRKNIFETLDQHREDIFYFFLVLFSLLLLPQTVHTLVESPPPLVFSDCLQEGYLRDAGPAPWGFHRLAAHLQPGRLPRPPGEI